MNTAFAIRRLVEEALHTKCLTPEVENAINFELTQTGYVSAVDYEALELMIEEMDEGRIHLVASHSDNSLPSTQIPRQRYAARVRLTLNCSV